MKKVEKLKTGAKNHTSYNADCRKKSLANRCASLADRHTYLAGGHKKRKTFVTQGLCPWTPSQSSCFPSQLPFFPSQSPWFPNQLPCIPSRSPCFTSCLQWLSSRGLHFKPPLEHKFYHNTFYISVADTGELQLGGICTDTCWSQRYSSEALPEPNNPLSSISSCHNGELSPLPLSASFL